MNESILDRAIRGALGVALIVGGLALIGGTFGTIVAAIGLIPLLTGIVGFCPIYRLLGMRTNSSPDDMQKR